MFTRWVTKMFTFNLNCLHCGDQLCKKIVINEWLRLNNFMFLMRGRPPRLDNITLCHRPWLIGGNHLSLKLAIRWSANRRCELARVGTPPKSSDLLQRKKQLLDSSTWLETTTYYTRFPRGTNRHLNRWDILHLKRYHTRNQWEYTNAHE